MTEASNPGNLQEIAFTKVLDAPREKVFQAWTEPAHFTHWWGGEGCSTPLDSIFMEVKPGGEWRATMVIDDGGMEIPFLGVYSEVSAPDRLAFTLVDPKDAADREERGDAVGEVVTIVLTATDGGTELSFHQSGHLTETQLVEATAGWESMIDALGTYTSKL
ncbi:SRPBCC domain-containing protein [Streptomyces sp. NPDC051567]|uniref:SRPBCC domain-containing protein n=1 Tax=Streptomyces sp. NPDC051567 TaxID=3365660 RepID=UPI00378D0B37